MTKKVLVIRKKPKLFAACVDCDKLYDFTEIISQSNDNTNTGFKCTHIEFLNHLMQNRRKPCESELLMKVSLINGHKWRPKMIYLLPYLKTQLAIMYK